MPVTPPATPYAYAAYAASPGEASPIAGPGVPLSPTGLPPRERAAGAVATDGPRWTAKKTAVTAGLALVLASAGAIGAAAAMPAGSTGDDSGFRGPGGGRNFQFPGGQQNQQNLAEPAEPAGDEPPTAAEPAERAARGWAQRHRPQPAEPARPAGPAPAARSGRPERTGHGPLLRRSGRLRVQHLRRHEDDLSCSPVSGRAAARRTPRAPSSPGRPRPRHGRRGLRLPAGLLRRGLPPGGTRRRGPWHRGWPQFP